MTARTSLRPRLGLILHRSRDTLFDALMSAMAAHGYVDGKTVALEPRFAEGVLERTTGFAEDLVRRDVDLIIAVGAVGARAAQKATSLIPIVFAIVLDPVDTGLAASFDRPGGNVTGVTNFDADLALSQLSLLKDAVPGLDRVAVLSDADIPRPQGWNPLERSCERAADRLGIRMEWFRTRGPTPDREWAFGQMVRRGCQALLVLEVPSNIADFRGIAALAAEHRLPAMFPGGWDHGGLMSYGTSLLQTLPEVPPIVSLVLNGTAPQDIPIRHVRQHRLRVDLAAARRIGLDLPPEILARADEVAG